MEATAPRIYQNKDLTSVLDISRSSLRYYERKGLIHPARKTDEGNRQYTDDDVRRIFSYLTLRNIGYAVHDAITQEDTSETFFGSGNLTKHRDKIRQRMERDKALLESLEFIAALGDATDVSLPEPTLVTVPEFELHADSHARRRSEQPFAKSLKALSKYAPLATLSATISFEDNAVYSAPLDWGCAVTKKHQHLVPLSKKTICCLGGFQGIRFVVRVNAHDGTIATQDLRAVWSYVSSHCSYPAAGAFLAHGLPTSKAWFPAALYVPLGACSDSSNTQPAQDTELSNGRPVSCEDSADTVIPTHALTARERDVFALLAQGYNEEDIAQHLVVSPNTAHTHIRHIYRKLNIHSRQELADVLLDKLP